MGTISRSRSLRVTGGGGGGTPIVQPEHFFNSDADRDAYFPTHLDELINDSGINTHIAVAGRFERWDGPNLPATYDNTQWTVLMEGDLEDALNPLEDKRLLIKDGATLGESPMKEMPDGTVESDSALTLPPGSLRLGGNIKLSAGGRCFVIDNEAYNVNGTIHPNQYNASGSITPQYYELAARQTTVRQALEDQQSVGDFNFNFTMPVDVLVESIVFRANAATTMGRLTIRLNSFTGPVMVDMRNVNVAVGSNQIDLPNAFSVLNGDTFNIEVQDMGSGSLNGTIISAIFIPYFETVEYPITLVNQDWPNDVTNAIASPDDNDAITFTRRDGTTFEVTLSGIYVEPRLFDLVLTDIPSRIDATADLIGSHNITFKVSEKEHLNESVGVRVTVNDVIVQTFAVSGLVNGDNNGIVTIDASEWADIIAVSSSVLTFRLTGVDTKSNNIISAPVVVERRDPAPHEFAYWDLSSTNNPATIDYTTMNDEEITGAGKVFDMQVTPTQGDYLILLVPFDHDVSTIFEVNFNIDVTDTFTETAGVRTINTVSYNSYVLGPLNGGIQNDYRVTLV